MELSHLNESGQARMVDVSDKAITARFAKVGGFINMRPEVIELITSGNAPKGDVLAAARIAGIQAAKRTSELIPLCHPLMIERVAIDFSIMENGIGITAEVGMAGKTGVEMEAFTAVAVAALTIYDMCKAADKSMSIGEICLLEKSGGRSGHYKRKESPVSAKIIATCLSEKKGTVKNNVGEINLIENFGVEGDAHAAPGKRQVSIISIESHKKLIAKGIKVGLGDFGENLTIDGFLPHELPLGTRLRAGDVELEVTQIGKECHAACAIKKQVGDCPMPREGIFVAVIKGGVVSVGQILEVV
ncbi:MAG: cyclic pyranopterin monophosphate synthase MoaC [bacterium]